MLLTPQPETGRPSSIATKGKRTVRAAAAERDMRILRVRPSRSGYVVISAEKAPARQGDSVLRRTVLSASAAEDATMRRMAMQGDMTIRELRTTLLRLPWPESPWMKGHAFGERRNILVLEVETQGGIVGMGYLFPFTPVLRTIRTCLEDVIVPRVLGKDATAVEAIWRDLWRATLTYGRGGIAMMAISALDIALWDAVGKRAGLPLHRLWGHFRAQLPVYGSGCWRGSGGDGMIAKALHYKQQGYKAIKMQVAHVHDLKTDLDNVRRMREAVGPDLDIMIDVNMGWTADVAIQMGRKLEAYDVYWLEEPVIADDIAGYMRIAEALDLRIVGGETHFARFDLRPFFE